MNKNDVMAELSSVRLGYIAYRTENDEPGARLMAHPEDTFLAMTTSRTLIRASENAEASQGIVWISRNINGDWRFERHLTAAEIAEHKASQEKTP